MDALPLIKRLKRIILVLFHFSWVGIFAGLIWGGVYLNTKGFSSSWRALAVNEFRKHGMEVSIRRLTLDPFRGLVAKDVRISDPRHDDEIFASISHVGLDIDYANLIRKKSFLNAIDVRDARLAIPVDPSDRKSTRFEARNFSARVYFSPGQIRLGQASFDFYGITVLATGTLLLPEEYKPEPRERSAQEREQRSHQLERIVEELQNTRYPEGPPVIEVAFVGNVAELEKLRIEKATVRAGRMEHTNIAMDRLEADLYYNDGILRLARLLVADGEGELLAEGEFSVPDASGKVQLRSSIALGGLADEILGRKLISEIVFYDPPDLEAEVDIRLGENPTVGVTGRIKLARFGLRSVVFDGFETAFSWEGDRLLLQDLRIDHRSGQLKVQLLRTPESVRLELENSLNPGGLAPLLEGKARALLEEWNFGGKTLLKVKAWGPSPDIALLQAEGEIACTNASYRGVPFRSFTANMQLKDRQVTYTKMRVEREEGTATGTFVYDFGKGEARMHGVKMNLYPPDVAAWVDPRLVKDIAPYRCIGAPHLEIDGTVKIGTSSNNQLIVKVNAPQGMLYEFAGKDLPFTNLTGILDFQGARLGLKDVRASLFGGRVNLNADISIIREDPGHSAALEMEGVNFDSVTRLYFDYQDSKGELRGNYQYRMRDNPRNMSGEGLVEVINGNVFAIPVLGPFSGILNGIVPGMGFSNARKAAANFTIREGVINTEDFEVQGQGFSMFGRGDLFFLDDKMDFSVRINAKGMPGVLLFPVSKLFEYVADDKLSKPDWRPKNLPRLQ